MQTTHGEISGTGRTAQLPSAMADQWAKIKATHSPRTAAAADTRPISNLLQQFAYIGDTCKIILGPDLDTYYTMAGLLLTELRLMERIPTSVTPQRRGCVTVSSTLPIGESSHRQRVPAQDASELRRQLDRAFESAGAFNDNKQLRPVLVCDTGIGIPPDRIEGLSLDASPTTANGLAGKLADPLHRSLVGYPGNWQMAPGSLGCESRLHTEIDERR